MKKQSHEGKPLPNAYNPWVRCLVGPDDYSGWQDREWIMYSTGLVTKSFSPLYASRWGYVRDYASNMARAMQARYGGKWCGVVRPEGQLPEDQPELRGRKAKKWAEKHILDGPDCPGRRMLLGRGAGAQTEPAIPVENTMPDGDFWKLPPEHDD